MKTIKLLFTATAVAIVAIATAVEKPKMSVVPLNTDRAVISILNPKAAVFELSIHDEKSVLVYYHKSTEPLQSYQKVFDFENLENGSYQLSLNVDDKKLSRIFEVKNEGLTIGKTKLRFDPYFAFDGKALKFSYLNFDQSNLKFNLYSADGLIFQTKLGKEFNLTSGYNLSGLKSGKYKAVLSSYNEEFIYELEK